ncbi:hypothetical protein CSUI_002474, partial [Cystoisospora suis]
MSRPAVRGLSGHSMFFPHHSRDLLLYQQSAGHMLSRHHRSQQYFPAWSGLTPKSSTDLARYLIQFPPSDSFAYVHQPLSRESSGVSEGVNLLRSRNFSASSKFFHLRSSRPEVKEGMGRQGDGERERDGLTRKSVTEMNALDTPCNTDEKEGGGLSEEETHSVIGVKKDDHDRERRKSVTFNQEDRSGEDEPPGVSAVGSSHGLASDSPSVREEARRTRTARAAAEHEITPASSFCRMATPSRLSTACYDSLSKKKDDNLNEASTPVIPPSYGIFHHLLLSQAGGDSYLRVAEAADRVIVGLLLQRRNWCTMSVLFK